MSNYLNECFLAEYFSHEVLIGDHADMKKIFYLLGDVFLLSKDTLDELCGLVFSDEVRGIRSESDYFTYCRIKKYYAATDSSHRVDEVKDCLITIKGSAISCLAKAKCLDAVCRTADETCRKLLHTAASGNVRAMSVAGFLMTEGVFVKKDVAGGLKYLRRAASWNSPEALLILLRYDGGNAQKYMGALHHSLAHLSEEDFAAAQARYGGAAQDPPEAVLLEKLFDRDILQREVYSAPHARILFGKALSFQAKERLLFSLGKEMIADAGDLPFKLSRDNRCAYLPEKIASALPVRRESELKAILQRLDNRDLRWQAGYRPLCLSSDSPFMLSLYAAAIESSLAGAQVEKIFINELEDFDFRPAKSNIFVRSCDENKENVYFLFFRGVVPVMCMNAAKAFLNGGSRRNFRLHSPSVCLDMSAVLPVCFCDSRAEDDLRAFCDVVRISDASEEEKPALIRHILQKKEALYGLPEISVESDAFKALCTHGIDDIEKMLDEAIRCNRKKGDSLCLAKGDIKEERHEYSFRCGFGG